MKYNKIIISLLAGAFTLTGCSDFLDQTPDTSKTASQIYNNVEEIQGRINTMYGNLCGNMYGTWIPILFGTNSDVELIDGIGSTATDAGERGTFNYFTTRADSWDTNGKLYAALYEEIGECNDIISGIQAGSLAEDEKAKAYMGEAMVIRAQMYMELTRIWGDVPFHTTVADGNDISSLYEGKTDRDYILDKMLEDLEIAEGYLDNTSNPSTKVSKWYAKALYVQIALQRCGYAIRENVRNQPFADQGNSYTDEVNGTKYPYQNASSDNDPRKRISDGDYPTLRAPKEKRVELYAKAIKKANDIIKNGGFSLVSSFDDYWTEVNLRHDNISENIFEIPTTQGETSELGYTIGVRMNWDENNPTASYGARNSSGKVKLVAPLAYSYEDDDTRRDVTCSLIELVDSLIEYNDEDGTPKTTHVVREKYIGDAPFGIYVGKWDCRKLYEKDPSWLAQNRSSEGKTLYGIHPVRMRLPQVYLYYAEIYNELQNDGAEIPSECDMSPEDAINIVHRRATGHDATIASGYDGIFDAIDKENKWEFAGEGFRKWDLIRWNLLVHHTLQMKLDYLNGVYPTTMAADVRYYPSDQPRYRQITKYYNFDWEDGSNGSVVFQTTNSDGSITDAGSFGSSKASLIDSNMKNWDKNYEKGLEEAKKKGLDGVEAEEYARKYQLEKWSVRKQIETNLPTISNGLVGNIPKASPGSNVLNELIAQLMTALNDIQNNVSPNGTTVKNRYIMPVTTNIFNNSNRMVRNSYGY